jgi:hypothetical protein
MPIVYLHGEQMTRECVHENERLSDNDLDTCVLNKMDNSIHSSPFDI